MNEDVLKEVLRLAAHYGATDAEVLKVEATEFTATVRRGEVESLTQSGSRHLGMRLYRGLRSACSSSADLSLPALDRLVAETLAMAQITSEDPAAALPELFGKSCEAESLALYDEEVASTPPDSKIRLALKAEEAALSADPRITNSEGATFSNTLIRIRLANSRGFAGGYGTTSCSLHVVPLASDGEEMQRDYWYTAAHRLRALEAPESLGRKAAARAVRRLGARKVSTQPVPVVFDPETAAQLMSNLSDAASGQNIYRQSSFLVGKLGKQICSESVTVYDDGRLPGGLASRPFDGDGTPTQRTLVVDRGILKSYLLNTYAARKLGMRSTGNAVRGISSPPEVGPTNFYLEAGRHTVEEIIATVLNGLYVTELIGFGVNIVNGDYSQGAVGMWIENGRLSYPVQEITIAGNLSDMLMNIEMIGNDLEPRSSIYCPTIKVGGLVVSGV